MSYVRLTDLVSKHGIEIEIEHIKEPIQGITASSRELKPTQLTELQSGSMAMWTKRKEGNEVVNWG